MNARYRKRSGTKRATCEVQDALRHGKSERAAAAKCHPPGSRAPAGWCGTNRQRAQLRAESCRRMRPGFRGDDSDGSMILWKFTKGGSGDLSPPGGLDSFWTLVTSAGSPWRRGWSSETSTPPVYRAPGVRTSRTPAASANQLPFVWSPPLMDDDANHGRCPAPVGNSPMSWKEGGPADFEQLATRLARGHVRITNLQSAMQTASLKQQTSRDVLFKRKTEN